VRGKNGGTGVGLAEVYDLDQAADSRLANISTRAFVGTGPDVLIGGFITGNKIGATRIAIRALGPSLAQFGITNPLPDPRLQVFDQNGTLLASNDNWQSDESGGVDYQLRTCTRERPGIGHRHQPRSRRLHRDR
jgi:hypothetical protein